MEKAELETKFEKVFGAKPEKTFFSPGRINLIGEHTDYNGGHVFPAQLRLERTVQLQSVMTASLIFIRPILKTRA